MALVMVSTVAMSDWAMVTLFTVARQLESVTYRTCRTPPPSRYAASTKPSSIWLAKVWNWPTNWL
ncbi:hypothetical protein [Amycolatopsis sp. MEPSY49]|uniref:hypothetical protein n=1 Tax=Amycolatopsis sp. MEPSY49 TaxID=3151600 RepID=UPI003EF34854